MSMIFGSRRFFNWTRVMRSIFKFMVLYGDTFTNYEDSILYADTF